jgi:hypothetical protein
MTLHYTLANADEKILLRGSSFTDQPQITLLDVYDKFKSGQTLNSIARDIPTLPRTKLLFARAFFASVNPEAYRTSKVTPLRVICDENVDPHIATDKARETFGEATHVSFLGLAYSRDVDIWKYAVQNQYNLIISRDKAIIKTRPTWDLTRCAHEFWQWRLNSGNNSRGGPTLLDRLAAKLSYKLLVCVMPPRLFFAPVFVHSVAGRSPRPEEQNLVYYRPHLAFVH